MLSNISLKNFPEYSWWAYFYSDGEKIISNLVAGIIPVGFGRRFIHSRFIYSTTTPSVISTIILEERYIKNMINRYLLDTRNNIEPFYPFL